MNKVEASCQSQGLALNTQLFTTQLGFTYGLSNVWSNAADGSTVISPSLTYLNNTLEKCTVNNILIYGENTNTIGNGPLWNWQSTIISAVATCSVYNGGMRSFFNVTVSYEQTPTTDTAYNDGASGVAFISTGFLPLDQKNKACLWWGQQLLHMWYRTFENALGKYADEDPATDANTIASVRIYMAPNEGKKITNLDFFNITGWFYLGDGGLQAAQYSGSAPSVELSTVIAGVDVGLELHHFATAFYSTILADLSQSNGQNVLTEFDLIQQYVLEGYDVEPLIGINSTGNTAQQAFDQIKTTTGPLKILPSTFNSRYIFQVPHHRNFGSVFIAVLVADIVFLQALFQILTLASTWYLERTDKQSKYCEGCKQHLADPGQEQSGEMVLLPVSRRQSKSFVDDGWKSPAVDLSSLPTITSRNPNQSAFTVPRKSVPNWQYERVVNCAGATAAD
jgi:hypothetical protein